MGQLEHTEQTQERFCQYKWRSCLDIGSGGESILGRRGVFTCDLQEDGTDFRGDYLSFKFPTQFEAIWCSHFLEHQRNVGAVLEKIRQDVCIGGVVAITVPPWRDKLVGGHLYLWTPAQLLYNMILAGFDCSEARVGVYGYNISVIVGRKDADLPSDLKMDRGDIETLAKFFPFPAQQKCDGNIGNINW